MPYKFSHFLKAFKLMGSQLWQNLKSVMGGVLFIIIVILLGTLLVNYFWYVVSIVAALALFCWGWLCLDKVKREEKR
jgi:preprotein translocase subunit SecE